MKWRKMNKMFVGCVNVTYVYQTYVCMYVCMFNVCIFNVTYVCQTPNGRPSSLGTVSYHQRVYSKREGRVPRRSGFYA